MSTKWIHQSFRSGTQVVQRAGEHVHYHVGHLPADTEGDAGRSDVGEELADLLNGVSRPWWFEFLSRKTADSVTTPHGCTIRATGPMIDTAKPPSWGCWKEDDTPNGQIARALAIEQLLKGETK